MSFRGNGRRRGRKLELTAHKIQVDFDLSENFERARPVYNVSAAQTQRSARVVETAGSNLLGVLNIPNQFPDEYMITGAGTTDEPTVTLGDITLDVPYTNKRKVPTKYRQQMFRLLGPRENDVIMRGLTVNSVFLPVNGEGLAKASPVLSNGSGTSDNGNQMSTGDTAETIGSIATSGIPLAGVPSAPASSVVGWRIHVVDANELPPVPIPADLEGVVYQEDEVPKNLVLSDVTAVSANIFNVAPSKPAVVRSNTKRKFPKGKSGWLVVYTRDTQTPTEATLNISFWTNEN